MLRDELDAKESILKVEHSKPLVFSEILLNIVTRIGHEGTYRDHCVYSSKAFYHTMSPVWLNNWKNRSVAWRLVGYQD